MSESEADIVFLELSRYVAKTFSVSNVLCESVWNPQACPRTRTDCNLPTAMDIKENLRARVLTMPGLMIIVRCGPRGNGDQHLFFINPTGVIGTPRKATYMSDENTHAVPDSSQEPEQRRNIEPKAAENSANPEIIQEEPHKRKRNYVPKTPQECERSKILKRGSTPLRERFMADMQYNSLSKATQKNYLNAVFDFIAHYYKSPGRYI